jgi:cell division protease FtsH
MVTEYGMSDKIGPITLGQKQGEVFLGRDFASHPDYSPQVAYEIDSEITGLIDRAHDEALEILSEQRAYLDTIADALLEHETIDKEELERILIDLPKRAQREGTGSGVAVARRSERTNGGPKCPGGTIG